MIVVMQAGASKAEIESVISEIERLGYRSHPIYGVERTVIGCIGDERGKTRLQALEAMPGVEACVPILAEIVGPRDAEGVAERADILQGGARNVQNCALLKRLGKVGKPILLKRGMMTPLQEFLMAAEYILAEGNPRVILCERGIRT